MMTRTKMSCTEIKSYEKFIRKITFPVICIKAYKNLGQIDVFRVRIPEITFLQKITLPLKY